MPKKKVAKKTSANKDADAIKAKYVAEDPEKTGDTWLYHDDCPEGKVFTGAAVEQAIDDGWWNDV